MKVLAIPEVHVYLQSLPQILYNKEYFSFKDTARKYVIDLFDEIKTTLPITLHKPAPKYFDKYGENMKYAVFKKNKNTHWYVFFTIYKDKGDIIYLIRYIGNNHMIAQYI